jgi:hypothetical protein
MGVGQVDPAERLSFAMQAAVPIRIAELRHTPLARILHPGECARLAAFIGTYGAAVEFKTTPRAKHAQLGGGQSPGTADAFRRLADGIARLAHMPGGFTFLGVHYAAPARSA